MTRSFVRSVTSSGLAGALLGIAATSSAQPHTSDEDRASARLLAADGIQMAASGDCAGAVDRLSRAEAIVHAPAVVVALAQCDIQLGKIITGTELLQSILNEPLPPNQLPAAGDAKKHAQAALDAAQPRIAKLRIHIDRPTTDVTGLEVTVDAQPVSPILLDGDLPVDPGMHHVAARQPGLATAEIDVIVTDGEAKSIALALAPIPAAAPASPTSAPAAETVGAAAPPGEARLARSSRSTTALVLYTAAGAGAFLGVAFGVAALVTKSNLDAECAGNLCPASTQSDIGALHTDAILSTVGWGIAAAGAIAGTIVLIAPKPTPEPHAAALVVRPWVGPASGGIAGTFQ